VIAATAAAKAGVPIRFVGEGEAREEILKANPNAEITGWVSPEQVHQEMLSARALAIPALWYETQGMVVQEALALGVPAIVSRTTAASEAIQDGKNGFLTDTGSVDQVAEAMLKLQDDGLACEMGKTASAMYWSNPAELPTHVDQILEIYQEALRK
jgi:glycosyltransferase involved in cell wall biosynthesis